MIKCWNLFLRVELQVSQYCSRENSFFYSTIVTHWKWLLWLCDFVDENEFWNQTRTMTNLFIVAFLFFIDIQVLLARVTDTNELVEREELLPEQFVVRPPRYLTFQHWLPTLLVKFSALFCPPTTNSFWKISGNFMKKTWLQPETFNCMFISRVTFSNWDINFFHTFSLWSHTLFIRKWVFSVISPQSTDLKIISFINISFVRIKIVVYDSLLNNSLLNDSLLNELGGTILLGENNRRDPRKLTAFCFESQKQGIRSKLWFKSMKNVLFKQNTIPIHVNFLFWKKVWLLIRLVWNFWGNLLSNILVVGETEKSHFLAVTRDIFHQF